MNHKKLRTQLLNQSILGLMSQLEDVSGLCMHEIDADLEARCIQAIDSNNPAVLNYIIKELEERHEQF